MPINWKLLALLASGSLSIEAFAQDTVQWWEIACAHSKISVPAGLKCRTTQNYAGGQSGWGADAGGTYRNWMAGGAIGGVQYFYFLATATSLGAAVATSTSLQDTIQAEMGGGKQASGFSPLTNRGGADYMGFTGAGGESCVGIRRYGPSAGGGNQWILYGVRCDPKGRTTSDAEIDRFIAGATVRGS